LIELRKSLILRRPPPGPRIARPEDRLHGRLEGRTEPVPAQFEFFDNLFRQGSV